MTAEQVWDSVVALANHEPDARDLAREASVIDARLTLRGRNATALWLMANARWGRDTPTEVHTVA